MTGGGEDFGASVAEAIGGAVERLRFHLGNDYGRYDPALRALHVAEAYLVALPLGDRARLARCGGDLAALAAGEEWMRRLDTATNDLEDLVQDMDAAAAEAEAAGAVGRWLGACPNNMVRMELIVGRLAGTCIQGSEIFDVMADDVDGAPGRGHGDNTSGSGSLPETLVKKKKTYVACSWSRAMKNWLTGRSKA